MEQIIRNMGNGKSSDGDEVTAKNLKYEEHILINKMCELVRDIWDTEVMPQQ